MKVNAMLFFLCAFLVGTSSHALVGTQAGKSPVERTLSNEAHDQERLVSSDRCNFGGECS